MIKGFQEWCADDSAFGRLTRTIVQAFIGALIAYLPDILAGSEVVPAEIKPLAIACAMAILSPLQRCIGDTLENGAEGTE